LAALEAQDPVSVAARLLAIRQMADISMLQGRFEDAIRSFESLSGADGDELWMAELHRFQGHVYRFNFDLVRAEKHYREALDLSTRVNGEAMRGKALTNLVETLCWHAPQTALSFAEEAVELNEQVNAPIEVGKALTAQAIAQLGNEEADEALATAQKAEALQTESGYRSGVLFALQAQGLALVVQNRVEEAQSILQYMRDLSEELGDIYPYLSMFLCAILEPERVSSDYGGFQWLDWEETLRKVHSLVDNFKGDHYPR
jgi:tetratricopeptide (TPR) repeat protein